MTTLREGVVYVRKIGTRPGVSKDAADFFAERLLEMAAPVAFCHHDEEYAGKYPPVMVHGVKVAEFFRQGKAAKKYSPHREGGETKQCRKAQEGRGLRRENVCRQLVSRGNAR